MRAVVQRVLNAGVTVDGECVGKIGRGYLVLLGVGHGDTRAEAYHALARERRRAGDVTAAIRLYETMLRRGDDPVSACEALAKLYEHRLHNPAQALTYTRQALLLLSEPGLFRSEAVQARQVALQYRYARLRRKLCAPCATSTKKEEPSSWES